MRTTGEIRILARNFIRTITDSKIIQDDDIRYLKSQNGVFPLKMVWSGGSPGQGDFKETPYVPNDTFILFDVVNGKNTVQETIANKTTSRLPIKLIVNIYGEHAEDVVQYMLSRLFQYDVKAWLVAHKFSLTHEPEEVAILDGRENAQWWKRRRIEFDLNIHQEFVIDEEVMFDYEINEIISTVEEVE